MFTVSNKYTRTFPLTSLQCLPSEFLAVFTPYSCASVADFEQVILAGTDDITYKASHNKIFSYPFVLVITKIYVGIHLAEDGNRMGGIQFQIFLSNFIEQFVHDCARLESLALGR